MSWKVLDHTADAGLEVSAASWNDLFLQSAEGFYFLCLDGTAPLAPAVSAGKRHELRLEALDLEELVVSWIHELLFLLESGEGVFRAASLSVTEEPPSLVAKGFLVPSPGARIAVKAATYGGMVLEKVPHPFLQFYLDL